jgi:prolipoprotein diacylglyceryltransferase
MQPLILEWRGIKIFSYPLMLYLGLVFGIIAGNFAANLNQLDSYRIFIATLILTIPMLIGARLLYVVLHWDMYVKARQRIWARSEGGAILYGGLVFLLLGSVPTLSLLHIPPGEFWDIATITILVAMIFTKIGCHLNGCCAGRVVKGFPGTFLPNHAGNWQMRLPSQILEAGWAALLLAGAILTWNRLPVSGALFLLTLTGYGLGRFFLESTREDQHYVVWRWTLNHIVSVILIGVSLSILIFN